MNRKSFQVLCILLGISVIAPIHARDFANQASWDSRDKQASVFVAVGQAEGEANELVYCQPYSGCPVDYKLSQLIWKTHELPMLITGLSSRTGRVTFNLEGRINLTEGSAVMDDYDWVYVNTDWSHWSHHEDTDVTSAWAWEVNFDIRLSGTDTNNIAGILGYRQELWAWESRGGSYIYSSTGNFRDVSGTFAPGLPVITYKQKFKMPYVGLKLVAGTNSLIFQARYIYSNQVDVSATDHHILRDLIFEDDFGKGEMSAYEVALEYRIGKQLGLLASYEVQDYKEVRGDTYYRDASTGNLVGYCTNCSGADNHSETWSLGLRYTF